MKSTRIIRNCGFLLLVAIPALRAQDALPEMQRIEAQAKERYAADDLGGAAEAYLALAQRSNQPTEQSRYALTAGWVLHQAEAFSDRDTALRRALQYDPQLRPDPSIFSADFLQRLQVIRLEEEAALSSRVADLSNRADAANAQNDFSTAIRLYSELLALQPTRPAVRLQLAVTQLNAGDPAAAASTLAPLAQDPELLDPTVRQRTASLMAMARIRNGQLSGIETDIQRVTGTLQRQLWLELASRLEQEKRWEEAISAYGSVLEIDPSDRETAILRSRLLGRLGRHGEAESFLINLSETLPESNAVWYELGVVREALDDDLGAASAYRRGARFEPHDTEDHSGRVQSLTASARLLARSEPDRALQLLQEARSLYPDRFEPLAMEARLLTDQQRYSEAVASASKALSLASDRVDLRNLLGNTYYLAGDYQRASQVFSELLADHPELKAVKDNLALARQAIQRTPSVTVAEETSPDQAPRAAPETAPPPAPRAQRAARSQAASTPGSTSVLELGLDGSPLLWAQTGRRVIRVDRVQEDSKASRCGLRHNDLIIRVKGSPTDSLEKVQDGMAGDTSGVRLDIVRENQPMTLVCI